MPRIKSASQTVYAQGFSLLELLLVLFILGLMTATTMLMTGGVEDQAKYDETKRRMEMIKRAIVGDTSRTVNGAPEISGFVADMGRLPNTLQELLNGTYTYDSATSVIGEVSIQLRGGWRGPYIDLLPDSGGERVLRDGYGNAFSAASAVGEWRVKSLGADNTAGTADDYPVSYALTHDANLLVKSADFEVGIGGVGAVIVDFGKPPAANPAEMLVLRIYYMEDGVMSNIEGTLPATGGTSSVAAVSGVASHPVTFGVDEALPLGRYAAVLLCQSSARVYDGDCTNNELHRAPYYFTVVPKNQTPIVIRWGIQ